MPRKHLVASQTNKKQQLQAKLWQKLAREIKAAVKVGGANVEANPRLKAAVDKALQNNLSRESIQRNISGSSKDPAELSTLEFECYGPSGLQLVIGALTDNINRTTSSIRGYLSKFHGEIAKPNSVKVFFNNCGDIIIYKDNQHTIDDLMELTMSHQVIDIIEHEDAFEILTAPSDFYQVKDLLTSNGYKLFESDIKLIPQSKISSLDDDTKDRLTKLLTLCDEDEDIQWVVTNYEEI